MIPAAPERLAGVLLGLDAVQLIAAASGAGIFSELARGPRTHTALARRLRLQPEPTRDVLDALLALGFVEREGDDDDAVYVSSREAARHLGRHGPADFGSLLARAVAEGAAGVAALQALLEIDDAAGDSAPRPSELGKEFVRRLGTWHAEALAALPEVQRVRHVLVVNGAGGRVLAALAAAAPRLRGLTLEHEADCGAATAFLAAEALGDRAHVRSLATPRWPASDGVLLNCVPAAFGCDAASWLARASDAAGAHGWVMVLDQLPDERRRHSAAASMRALARRLAAGADAAVGDGFETGSAAALAARCRAVGLPRTRVLALADGASAMLAQR